MFITGNFSGAYSPTFFNFGRVEKVTSSTTARDKAALVLTDVQNYIMGVQPIMTTAAMLGDPRDVLTGPHSLPVPWALVLAPAFPWPSWLPFSGWCPSVL